MAEKINDKEKPSPAVDPRRSDQDISRDEKIAKLIEAGIDLFPYRADKTHSVSDVVRDFAVLTPDGLEEKKAEVVVPGRILSIRKMGRATFATISDSRAKLQVYLREDRVGERAYRLFPLLDIGEWILWTFFQPPPKAGFMMQGQPTKSRYIEKSTGQRLRRLSAVTSST